MALGTTDRKRAEEIAAQLGLPTHGPLVSAITTFASEVRKEQREKDAQIVETEIPVARPDGDSPAAPFVRAVITAIRKGESDA